MSPFNASFSARLYWTARPAVVAAVAALAVVMAAYAAPAAGEAYGTFECMGVVADVPAGHTAAEVGQVKVYIEQGGAWKRVQDALQVGSENIFASSVFGLTPNTAYNFKVEFYDLSNALMDTQTISGSTRADIVIPAPVTARFVSPTGSDSAAGTIEAPFKTLARALSAATAGTTIYLRAGTYFEGDISMGVSGTSGAPIVIRSYNGEDAVIDGADPGLVSTTWTSVQAQVYRHAFSGGCLNASLRRKSDGEVFRAYPMATAAEVTSRTSAGKTFDELKIDAAFCADGTSVTMRVPAGTIADYDVYVSRHTAAVTMDGRAYIYFDGLTFAHYGSGTYGKALYVRNTSDVLVQNCKFLYNNCGVYVKLACDRVVVQDNVCLDDMADWSWNYNKGAAIFYAGEIERGIVVVDNSYSGRGMVVRRNDIRGTFDGAELGASLYSGGRTMETDFYDNVLYHIGDDGVELDGKTRNVRVFDNSFSEMLDGISLAQALDGPSWLVRNSIIDCGIIEATQFEGYESYPVKTNGGPSPEIGSGPVVMYHNTSWTSDPGSRAWLVKGSATVPIMWKTLIMRNNIWCGQDRGFESRTTALSPVDWDYDVLYRANAANFLVKIGATTYSTIEQVRSARGWLLHGTSQEPGFVSAGARDFRLALGSPCKDTGVVLPGINDDYSGAAPDMGAFEAVDAPLAITTTSLPDGTVGAPYDAQLAATGGVSPYTWSIDSGTLPAGLSLNSATGVISGTPTTGEERTFVVKVTDSPAGAAGAAAAASATRAFSL